MNSLPDIRLGAFILVVCCALIGVLTWGINAWKRRQWDKRCAEVSRGAKERREVANLTRGTR